MGRHTQLGRLKVKRFYKLNSQIAASQVRLIDEEGKQIGIMTTAEALKKAHAANLDLVEIAPDAKPPVAKIIEFKKFKYQQERKEKEARKHTKQTELKEVRFTPFMGDHDFKTAIGKTKRFLAQGDLVKTAIRFKGRQMAHTEFGPKLLSRILSELEGLAEQERAEKFLGRQLTTILRPVKVQSKIKADDEIKNQKGSS